MKEKVKKIIRIISILAAVIFLIAVMINTIMKYWKDFLLLGIFIIVCLIILWAFE